MLSYRVSDDNRPVCELLGYGVHELAGLPLEDSLASGVRLLREIRSEDKIEYARVEF